MHIVITREKVDKQFETKVRVYRSLSEAFHKAFAAAGRRELVQFCIDHPNEDVMSIDELRTEQ